MWGHEFIGVIEDTGSEVVTLKQGGLVVAPFAFSDGTCKFCRGLLLALRRTGHPARVPPT